MSVKLYALVGIGPNDVEITSTVSTDRQKLIDQTTKLLGIEPQGTPTAPYWNHETLEDIFAMCSRDNDGDEDEEKAESLSENFFTSYYGGCGECYRLEIREFEEGKPISKWNLD